MRLISEPVKKFLADSRERVGGPRRMLIPPEELDPTIEDDILASRVVAALDSFRDARPIDADEWERLHHELLHFFGLSSVASFERKKHEVTVRRALATGEIRLLGPRDEELTVDDANALGRAIRELLRLPPSRA